MTPFIQPVEKFIYRIVGVDEKEEMNWKQYAYALIVFNIISIIIPFRPSIVTGIFTTQPPGTAGCEMGHCY